MRIDWLTVVFELVNFGLLLLIGMRFVFRPVREILTKRQAQIVERARETAAREAAARETQARYELELSHIEQHADQRVAAALAEARTKAEQIIAEARSSARAELDEAETELALGRRRTLERFRAEVMQLAAEAARRIVGELGDREVGLAFARRAAHALDDALDHQLAGPVDVRHSPELEPGPLAELLHELLGPKLELQLRVDERLIAGVVLGADGHEVEASVGHSLDTWYRSLLGVSRGDQVVR